MPCVLVALALLLGCQALPSGPRTESAASADCSALLERAIAARGGPLRGFRKSVEARVYLGFPGTWHLDTVFLVPEYYRWTVHTTGESDHYIWNGKVMLSCAGGALVATDASARAPLRSHARWTAVAHLDALRLGNPPPRLRCGPYSLDATFDDGAAHHLRFDERLRVVEARGPISLPPLGDGTLVARFGDFRRFGSVLVAGRVSYFFRGQHAFDERVLSFVPNDPAITPELFDAGG